MRYISRIYTVVGLVLIIIVSLCFPTDVYNQNEASKHLASANASQPQGPVKEPQKVEQSISDKIELNRQLLHEASSAGITFMKKLYIANLLSKGADVNAIDEYGLTSLHHAVRKGNKDIVTLLLANGAAVDVNVQDVYGLTPLHHAAAAGDKEIVSLLLAHGVVIDAKDNAGRTALHYAAEATYMSNDPQEWSVGMIHLLIDAGADINVQDAIGWTPLHHAAARLNKEIVAFLVSKGADLSIVDNRGDTVYSWNRARASFQSRHAMDIPHEIINQYNEIAELLRVNNEAYVVAINGNDSNPGTLDKPFKTIAAALECVGPGNIIYIRGGIYHCEGSIRLDKSGARANPIWLKAYPGEKPIIDFSGVLGDSLFISGAYWHIKGLVIINGQRGVMVWGPGACHNVLDQITTYANGWGGILLRDGAAYNIILNCDSSKNFDPEFNGDTCDGFSAAFLLGQGNFFIGNRSWNNSDDGYDCWKAVSELQFENCYAWDNGENIWDHPFWHGNGNGFKLGQGGGRHVLIDCTAWGHKWGAGAGFTLNGNSSGVILRNCSAWGNRTNYEFASDYWESIGGAQEDCVFMNNISLDGERKDAVDREAISQSNNWDPALGVQLTDSDFLSLDDSQMSAPRNPDGSIPQNDFLKLAPGSTAIDKGLDLGIHFVGAGPDLGTFEYDPNETSEGYVKMLHQAVRDHDVEEINNVLTAGAGINDKDWLVPFPVTEFRV